MSIVTGEIYGSSSFAATLLSDMDDLGFTVPTNVYHRWNMQSTVVHTTNDTQTLFSFALPSSIIGDCAVYLDIYRLSICTAGTFAGSVASQKGVFMMNRNGSTWTAIPSWPGAPHNTYINVSTGILSMSATATRSGDTISYKLTGIASQTISSKAFVNVMVVKTP